MNKQIYSTGQVARLLNLQAYKIEYACANGYLEEPPIRFLGKRVFTDEDVQRVADHFNLPVQHINEEEQHEVHL